MTAAAQLAYRVQKRIWRLLRPRTRGVKVMLFNDAGEIMLIRNGYGRSDLFVLPGGGVRPFETPEHAASREIREELGCDASALRFVSTFVSTAEGKRDTIHLYTAHGSQLVRPDGREVVEAAYHMPDTLPDNVSPATARRVQEHLSQRQRDG